jgi:tetratricopeptide (TPR) repeat protein
MRYVFRRGMVLLYLGLITAYGAIAFVGPLVLDGTVNRIFYGILFTSTILHYYYDGFIWKVRETTNQASLGLSQSASSTPARPMWNAGVPHLLKWGPVMIGLGLLFATDFLDPSLTTSRKEELDRVYSQSLTGNSVLPRGDEEQSWLYAQFERAQHIAAAVPGDRQAQLRAAILLANFGRNDEADDRLRTLLNQHPAYSEAHAALGGIHLYRGNFDQASASLQLAVEHARTEKERAIANVKWGEFYLLQRDPAAAEERFAKALEDNPSLKTSIDALRESIHAAGKS